jgi:lysophospholipase
LDVFTFKPAQGIEVRCARARPEGEARGSVVVLHGRTEFVEKYREVVGELCGRRFEVWTFDWRGQGLSTRLLENRSKGYVGSFQDYLEDLTFFLDQVYEPCGGPRVVLGHSMGGNVGLSLLTRRPDAFDVGVFTAPMLGVNAPVPTPLLEAAMWGASRLGLGQRYLSGGDYGIRDRRFFGNKLTGDLRRFARTSRWIDANPKLGVGGITVGWMAAACAAMSRLADPEVARKMETPALLLCAGREVRVDNTSVHAFAQMAPGASVVTLPAAKHEILHETDEVRARFWGAFDAFVEPLVERHQTKSAARASTPSTSSPS